MIKIKVEDIKKFFPCRNGKSRANGGVEVPGGINLEVIDGEFLTIVSISGCGMSARPEVIKQIIEAGGRENC